MKHPPANAAAMRFLALVCLSAAGFMFQHLTAHAEKVEREERRRLKVATFSPMSVAQTGRTEEIHRVLSTCSVIALQGTREKQISDQPIAQFCTAGYHRIVAGYGKKGNRHAGVSLSLKSKHYSLNTIHAMDWPKDPRLAGRGLAVRVRQRSSDLTHVCLYLPPCTGSDETLKVANDLLKWARQLLQSLPSRSLPILYMDANARLGLVKDLGRFSSVESTSVGVSGAELENSNGRLLRNFLEQFGLVAVKTIRGSQSTFYPGSTIGANSRVDYICCPASMWYSSQVDNPRVLMAEGDRLQLVKAARRVDHRPVAVSLSTSTLAYTGKEHRRWDQDKLMSAVLGGTIDKLFSIVLILP